MKNLKKLLSAYEEVVKIGPVPDELRLAVWREVERVIPWGPNESPGPLKPGPLKEAQAALAGLPPGWYRPKEIIEALRGTPWLSRAAGVPPNPKRLAHHLRVCGIPFKRDNHSGNAVFEVPTP